MTRALAMTMFFYTGSAAMPVQAQEKIAIRATITIITPKQAPTMLDDGTINDSTVTPTITIKELDGPFLDGIPHFLKTITADF